jgi:lipopolysaccharide heptosyltransferase II
LKILILKPSSLGDVVQAIPVLRLLKRHHPGSEVHWWVGTESLPLLAGDPDLAGLFPFDRHGWKSPLRWFDALKSIREMRRERFDWVIDLQGLARSGLFAWLANGNFTIGVEDHREGAPAFYDAVVPRPSPSAHAVDWYLEVLRFLGIPVHDDFTWLPERPDIKAAVLHKWHPDPGPWIIINPGARWLNKRWPAAHFAEVVRQLALRRPELRFAILGGRGDAPLAGEIALAAPGRCLDLAGRTSLPEMVEWVRASELVITNDTGPMHVAAALKKPVLALFGPTDPRRTGPYGQVERALRNPLPCSPCLKSVCHHTRPVECLDGLQPALVVSEALARLGLNRST